MSDSKLSIRRKCIKINLVTIALFLLDVSFNETEANIKSNIFRKNKNGI